MRKTVITYGLISGAIIAIMMIIGIGLFAKKSNFEGSMVVGYITMILAFLVIYPGMASYRDNIGGGTIKYGRALSIGLLITVISSICYVITWVIIYHTVFPDFMEKYAAYIINKMKEKGASATAIDKQMTELKHYKDMYKNPVTMCLLTFIEPLPVGIIISVIAAFIVRMKKKTAKI